MPKLAQPWSSESKSKIFGFEPGDATANVAKVRKQLGNKDIEGAIFVVYV